MVKIGDLVRRKGSTDLKEVYKVSGIKSNFQGIWITLSTNNNAEELKHYPWCIEKVWMKSQDFDVLEDTGDKSE